MSDNNHESKASTGNIIGDNNKPNQKAKQPVYHRYNLRNRKRQPRDRLIDRGGV